MLNKNLSSAIDLSPVHKMWSTSLCFIKKNIKQKLTVISQKCCSSILV